jgi:hypothetical protein
MLHTRGVAWVEMDVRRMEENSIPIKEDLIKHRVRVRLGAPSQSVEAD